MKTKPKEEEKEYKVNYRAYGNGRLFSGFEIVKAIDAEEAIQKTKSNALYGLMNTDFQVKDISRL